MHKLEPGNTHLVFGKTYVNVLLKNQQLASLIGSVLSLNDNLGMGPISNLNTPEGRSHRVQWLKQHVENDPENQPLASYVQQDYEVLEKLKTLLNQRQKLYLWLGDVPDERLAAARICHFLQQPLPGLLMLDLPADFKMKNLKGVDFYPQTIRVVQMEKVHLLAEYFREVKLALFEQYENCWIESEIKNKHLRVWEEGRVRSVAVDYFDQLLLKHCRQEFQKSATVVGYTLTTTGFQVSDHFLNWRLHELVRMRLLEKEGNLGPLRDYKVRLNLS